jgi:hypothetical protein
MLFPFLTPLCPTQQNEKKKRQKEKKEKFKTNFKVI